MYTNSPLAKVFATLPHRYLNRTKIDTIAIHCVAGVNASLQAVWNVLNANKCSCNYSVDSFGEIGLFVPEEYGTWCSSSMDNDMRAVTIEVVNNGGAPLWTVSDAALQATINLCADICRRNGKKRMTWIEDKKTALAYQPQADEMRMTVHRWFANKACPGDYLMSKMGYIAEKVTEILGGAAPAKEEVEDTIYRVQTGAFRDKANAQKMLKDLQTKGYEGIIVKVGELFKVQLGAFRSRTNAENLMHNVSLAVGDAFITSVGGQMVSVYTKSVNEVALEVIQGKWGSGQDRIDALTKAGYDAKAVQDRVNGML